MRSLLFVPLLGLVACVDALPDESSSTSNVETHNRLAGNRLAGNKLAAIQLSASQLASSRISDDALVLDSVAAAELLATADGREVLTYIVSCAVPEGTTLVVENPPAGSPPEYFGALGVAPQWLDAPLDNKGIGWVSACLFARVNANDEAVPISLRGSNTALATSPEEVTNYPLQEGAFYGNYFTPADEPVAWYACRGHAQAAGEGGGLTDRDCTEADPGNPGFTQCGFIDRGECFDNLATKKPDGTCLKETDGNFGHCDMVRKGGPAHEVITTYVPAS